MSAPGRLVSAALDASVDQRLQALGLTLPELGPPRGNFTPFVLAGATLYLSGRGAPQRAGVGVGQAPVPKVGDGVSVDEARGHARDIALYQLAVIRHALSGFERVERFVKLLVMVNAHPDFVEHTAVANGCSDLIVELFGARGVHARSAVGVGSLPTGFAVEIEMVVAVTPAAAAGATSV